MIWKLAGGVLVAAASLMNGLAARQSLSRRLELLRQLRLGLELLQGEMELHMASLPELFEAVGQRMEGELGEFFIGTAVKMAAVTGRPLMAAMKLQMEEQPLGLPQQEKNMLLELSGALGRYDLGWTGQSTGTVQGTGGAADRGIGGCAAAEGARMDDSVRVRRPDADSAASLGGVMDIDLIFKIAAVGIIVSILNQVLVRSGREEQATMTTLAGLVVVLMILVQKIAALFDMVKTLFQF